MSRPWWLLLVGISIWLAAACSRCDSAPMAQLTQHDGPVQRDFRASVEHWESAETGAEFAIGDAVKTLPKSKGTVTFDDGAILRLEPSTTVRFLEARPDETNLDVQSGEAVLEAGNKPLRVRTQMGIAVLDQGSITRFAKGDKGLRIFVTVGLARLQGDGPEQVLEAGQGVEVGIGMAILDRFSEEPVATRAPAASAAPSEEEEVPDDVHVAITGSGAQVHRVGKKGFEPLPPGDHVLATGTELKLGNGDDAKLSRGKASADLSGPGTFVLVEDPQRIVEPVLGTAILRADGKDVAMKIPDGTVTALGSEGLSIGEVQIDPRGRARLRVRAGKVRVDLPGGPTVLRAGESGDVNHGKITVSGRGLDFFDIEVPAGGSLLIHDPAPPTAVGVTFSDKCDGVGLVEQRGTSASGAGQANLRFERGRHGYKVYCLSADGKRALVASGTVTVLADSGTAALPNRAPSNVVNTDGREYTLLYQNLLPSVTVRWPGAPKAESYTLVVTSRGTSKRLSASSASLAFASGKLSEGAHSFQWRTSSGRKSRTSKATIRFDNAAPKASISSPANRSFAPLSSVFVAGIALPGWQVRAQGQTLHMDSEQRFSGSVTSGTRGLVLAFSHPQRGVHYYLRRASGISR